MNQYQNRSMDNLNESLIRNYFTKMVNKISLIFSLNVKKFIKKTTIQNKIKNFYQKKKIIKLLYHKFIIHKLYSYHNIVVGPLIMIF